VRLLADHGHEVCAAVGDADALREAVAAYRPDAAIVDIRMPPGHTDEGLRAAIELRRDHPEVGVLVFSQYVETRYAARLLAAHPPGGVGCLPKDRVADLAAFLDALRRVAAGGTALDPEVVGHLLRANRATGLSALTPRERDVLALMAEGRSNTGIAAALVVSG